MITVLVSVVMILLAYASPAAANPPDTATEAPKTYDIPAQPLARALTALGTVSRLDILYENGVVDGKRSSALAGTYTSNAAISAMLEGTGLLFRFTSANAVLVFPPERPPERTPAGAAGPLSAPRMVLNVLRVTASPLIGTPSRARFEPYGRAVQSEINRRLQEDARIRGQPFRARVAVNIDIAGVITRLDLTRTTGDGTLDDHIRQLLVGARMSAAPPADLPQPIWFEVAAR